MLAWRILIDFVDLSDVEVNYWVVSNKDNWVFYATVQVRFLKASNCSEEPSLSGNGDRCGSLLVVLIGSFRVK